MKKFKRSFVSLLLIATLLSTFVVHADSVPSAKESMRGVWVATVLNIDYPAKPTTDADVLKAQATTILDNAQRAGLNAVFLQVRPTSDALYASQYFPWSKYLTGTQGQAPNGNFDPLAFWVSEAHKRGIELHAWVNPYRVTKKTAAEPAQTLAQLAPTNPARLHPDWVIKYTDGNYYYNPGIPEVRQLIVDSSVELIKNYGVDGIHFDDYFYPGKDFGDSATFAKYGSGFKSIDDWRRDNVNTLVRNTFKAVHAASSSARFGISPFGIWANQSSNPNGSDTKGQQSYSDHYADSLTWIHEGSVDYIAPQLYWNIGYTIADYSKLLSWWQNAVSGSSVDLYIGQAAYRVGNSDASSPWHGVSEIDRQLQMNSQSSAVKGSIFYNYSSLASNGDLVALLQNHYANANNSTVANGSTTIPGSTTVTPSVPITVSRPSGNINTTLSKYYVTGASDPSVPLYVNSTLVQNRSSLGYFGVLIPIAPGKNTITLTQGNSTITRIITKSTGSGNSGGSSAMKTADIPAASTFPQSQEMRAPGETIKLSCQAPIGSTVTVKIGGKSYAMTPGTTKATGGIYPTTFSCNYALPNYTGAPRVVDLGAPVYTFKYKNTTKSVKAPASVGVILQNAPFYAVISKDIANTITSPGGNDGAANELYQGMTDTVTAMTGNYVRLSSGLWIAKASVQTFEAAGTPAPVIKNVQYVASDKWDTLLLDMSSEVAATASFDGKTLKLSLPLIQSGTAPTVADNALFASVTPTVSGNHLDYLLTLKDGQQINGYVVSKTQTGIMLNIKRPFIAKGGDQPLSGMTVVLDPGHGGSDSGAIGPLGTAYSEKAVNLNTALKVKSELEKDGATVVMTRTTDTDVSLDQRLAVSRNTKPDLFMSLHSNSMDDSTDSSNISGFSAYYREVFASSITTTLQNTILNTLQRKNMGVHANNFYVTRGTWTPSMLLETGFVSNPNEFQWLSTDSNQSILAKTIADGIVKTFASK